MPVPQLDPLRHAPGSAAGRLATSRPAPGPAPVLLFVPGGAWVQGTRVLQGHTLLSHLVAQGWVCVTMDYRVSPVHRWPRHIQDVNAAIAWTRANIDQFGGDRGFVTVAGCQRADTSPRWPGSRPVNPSSVATSPRTPTPPSTRSSASTVATTGRTARRGPGGSFQASWSESWCGASSLAIPSLHRRVTDGPHPRGSAAVPADARRAGFDHPGREARAVPHRAA